MSKLYINGHEFIKIAKDEYTCNCYFEDITVLWPVSSKGSNWTVGM